MLAAKVKLLPPIALIVHLAPAAEMRRSLDGCGRLDGRWQCEEVVGSFDSLGAQPGIDRRVKKEPAALAQRATHVGGHQAVARQDGDAHSMSLRANRTSSRASMLVAPGACSLKKPLA